MRHIPGLPGELIYQILDFLDLQDLQRSLLTSRAFHSSATSVILSRYIQTLDALGYTIPSVPREDLSPYQRLAFLERKRGIPSLDHIQYIRDFIIIGSVQYFGGVYFYCARTGPKPGEGESGLGFLQLKSDNLGLQSKKWNIPFTDRHTFAWAIDPAQDLLVLLVAHDSPSASSSMEIKGAQIHLKTMSTNQTHPSSSTHYIVLEFPNSGATSTRNAEQTKKSPFAPWKGAKHSFEILGGLLAILFAPRNSNISAPWIGVWDWRRGLEVTRILFGPGVVPVASFTLLSQNALAIPLNPGFMHQKQKQGSLLHGSRSLRVYTFDPQAHISTPPRLAACFDFPQLRIEPILGFNVWIVKNSSGRGDDGRPRVYARDPQEQTICMSLEVCFPPGSETHVDGPCLLYVPSHLLLDPQAYFDHGLIASQSENSWRVPWLLWGRYTSWIDSQKFEFGHAEAFDGEQTALYSVVEPGRYYDSAHVHVFSLNQKQVQEVQERMEHATVTVRSPERAHNCNFPPRLAHLVDSDDAPRPAPPSGEGASNLGSDWRSAFFGDPDSAPQLRYKELDLKVDSVDVLNVRIDDERVVFERMDFDEVERSTIISLSVYTWQ